MSEYELKQARKVRVKASEKTYWMAKTGILSAFAIVLMYLEFSLPLMPVFLKFDFAEVPALLGAFALGPSAGLLIELVKNISHLPFSQTGFIGELSNFIVCGSFVFVAGLIYKHKKTKKNAVVSLIVGTIVMTLVGIAANYFINIPFYFHVMGLNMDMIIGMTSASGNPLVTDMRTLLLYVFVPFNIFKGTVISLIVLAIYKKISPVLHK